MRARVLAVATVTVFGACIAALGQQAQTRPVARPPATAATPGPTPTPGPRPVTVQKRNVLRPAGLEKVFPTPTPTPTPFAGFPCKVDRDCESGACEDGICCDRKCDGNCFACNLPGHVGICTAVPDGQDPRKACQASIGGSPECWGACYSGRCAVPDVGTRCGICMSCDGTGRCTATPADDERCGVIDCSRLDFTGRVYQDLTANRCNALGQCKQANDPATCVLYTEQPHP